MIKNCIICNKEFETTRNNTVTCSDECKLKRRRQTQNNHRIKSQTLYKRECAICGKPFETYRDKQILCGKEKCTEIYKTQYSENYNNVNRELINKKRVVRYRKQIKDSSIKLICSLCGKEFDSDRRVKFCSDECRNQKRKEYNTNYVRKHREKLKQYNTNYVKEKRNKS